MSYYGRQQNQKRSEATEQEALIAWCGWQQNQHPELKLIYHVPNGGSRNPLEAANLKRQGVKAGVPDLCLPVPRSGFHGLYIEMKYGRNKTTEKQEEWLKALEGQGYFTTVCYGAEEAERVLSRYLGFPGYPKIENRAIPMNVFAGAVPEALCTGGRLGDENDSIYYNEYRIFHGCGHCYDNDVKASCKGCVVSRIFEEYARLTGQKNDSGLLEHDKPDEVTVAGLIEILKGMDQNAIVINGREKNIRIYLEKECKDSGRNIVMIC